MRRTGARASGGSSCKPSSRKPHSPAAAGLSGQPTATTLVRRPYTTSLDAGDRPGRVTAEPDEDQIEQTGGTRLIIIPHSHGSPIAPGHMHRQTSGTPQADLRK